MNTCTLCGFVGKLIGITILGGVCVTEAPQTQTVVMCTRRNNTQCNLDAVNCGPGSIITIVWLYYRVISVNRYNTQCNDCPDCCQDTDWRNKETGGRLLNLKNVCNDKQACEINSVILKSSNGGWRAKIGYKCDPLLTTSTTSSTTVLIPSLITTNTAGLIPPTPPPNTTSVLAVTETTDTSASKPTTKATTGGETKNQTLDDDFPTTVAVPVPLSLVVVGIIVFIVVYCLRKQSKDEDTPDQTYTDLSNSINNHGNETYSNLSGDVTYTNVSNSSQLQ